MKSPILSFISGGITFISSGKSTIILYVILSPIVILALSTVVFTLIRDLESSFSLFVFVSLAMQKHFVYARIMRMNIMCLMILFMPTTISPNILL